MFMITRPRFTLHAIALSAALVLPLKAQQASQAGDGVFATENAILDTSILFAIGAREARQELRGAFGWPTYQEGLVEGVYFRFDPDGYARFASTPRLDTDVFEVICRPRTHVCLGRKNALLVTLNARGQVELQVENIGASDTFAVSEGINELPLPASILQQLDQRMEILLASGGELVVRRAEEVVERISLKGFSAVVSYLRWVAAQQDYLVLPRGWPVPNTGTVAPTPGLTQTTRWQSPMPQPAGNSGALLAPTRLDPTFVFAQSGAGDVAEVKDELKTLRNILEKREDVDQTHASGNHNDDIARLQRMVESLSAQVWAIQSARELNDLAHKTEPSSEAEAVAMQETPENGFAARLEYLMSEIGLAPDVALMLLQQGTLEDADAEQQPDVVEALLNDLRAQLPQEPQTTSVPNLPPSQDYQLLTEYFRSVFADTRLSLAAK